MSQSFRSRRTLSDDILRFKIGNVNEKLLKFNILLISRTLGTPEGKILAVDGVSQNRLNTIK